MPKSKALAFKNYLRLVTLSHIIFALPFALIGYFWAVYPTDIDFSWKFFVLVVVAVVFASNSAMSFTRVTDRFIDKRNPRTASREIPSGKIHPRHAFMFSMFNAVFFIITTYFINKLVFYLSPAALVVILGYTYTKRFTTLCHFVLGMALALTPVAAYLAVTGKWSLVPVLFSAIVFLWVTGFDILYSIQDEDFDKEEYIKSIPAVYGRKKAWIISAILHLGVILLVIKTGLIINTGFYFWIGAAAFILLMALQYLSIKASDPKKISFAFATLNGLASLLFAGFTIFSFYM